MLWTWHPDETQWIPRTLQPGEEHALSDQARLWVIDPDRLVLFARLSAAVNGHAALPIHPLADRDEITIGTAHWCVSFDSMPMREIFRATDQPLQCGRCCGPLGDGEAVIVCPQCRAHHHDSETLPCWTYGPTCGRCHRPTGETLWQPAPLHRSQRRGRPDAAHPTR